MSLFENSEYQWRETYFVFLNPGTRPTAEQLQGMLEASNKGYELQNLRCSETGEFESLTLLSKDDYAAMDITCVPTEEMQDQINELVEQLEENALPDEKELVAQVRSSTCRIEVYHFEQLVFVGSSSGDDPDDFMDPGSLLVVLNQLAEMCDGVVVDPQSNSFL